MVTIGEDQTHTAMAKTVGLPIAMATIAILNKIKKKGVTIPLSKENIYSNFKKLKDYGINFKEKKVLFGI